MPGVPRVQLWRCVIPSRNQCSSTLHITQLGFEAVAMADDLMGNEDADDLAEKNDNIDSDRLESLLGVKLGSDERIGLRAAACSI